MLYHLPLFPFHPARIPGLPSVEGTPALFPSTRPASPVCLASRERRRPFCRGWVCVVNAPGEARLRYPETPEPPHPSPLPSGEREKRAAI
jgi:hypothetical protein